MEFNHLVDSILNNINESWQKGTSKAPKGDSYDMARGGAPSRVDAASDGSGGRYRRTRPPSARSKKTHSEMEEQPAREDGEYDMGEVLDAIAADFANDMTKSELEAKYGTDAVAKFISYGDEDRHPSEDDVLDDFYSKRELERMKNPDEDAEYRGRKVSLNKPTRGDVKKFKVYVKDPKSGNVKKVNFGHGGTSAKRKGEKTMKIRKSNPKARKSFRARHNCDNPGPKTKARYWSCRKW